MRCDGIQRCVFLISVANGSLADPARSRNSQSHSWRKLMAGSARGSAAVWSKVQWRIWGLVERLIMSRPVPCAIETV